MEPNLADILEDIPHALVDGLTVESASGSATLRHQHAGDLVATSGAVVACDPKMIEEDTIWPFVTRVAPGQYPVTLSIADFADGDQRVAYATLHINERHPVRWAVARFPQEAAVGMPEEEIPAYGVDTGTGCFMDADAAQVWAHRINTIANYDMTITDEMDRNGTATCGWATHSLEPDTRANLVVFSAGAGDGAYASYVGYDANDAIVCFVTDFALLWRDN